MKKRQNEEDLDYLSKTIIAIIVLIIMTAGGVQLVNRCKKIEAKNKIEIPPSSEYFELMED